MAGQIISALPEPTHHQHASAMNDIIYHPIGIIHSPFKEAAGTPIQPAHAAEVQATVEVYADFVPGLNDLEGFSHVILLVHLHKSRPHRLKVVPFLDTEERGVFATRAPSRPNSIGLSVVRLLTLEGSLLSVQGMDLLDGTPLLDIKPYVGDFDNLSDARMGWYADAQRRHAVADDRFA